MTAMDAPPRFRSFYELSRDHRDGNESSSAMSDSSVDDADHVRHIQESWEQLRSGDLAAVGRRVYEKVVMKNIEVATLFQDTTFEHQHTAFMTMMGQSIEWLDDMAGWHRRMMPLAQRHIKYQVKPQHYKHFRSAFLKAIREFQKDDWTEEREDAWIWYWGKIMDTLGHATQSNLQNSTIGVSQFAHYARTIHEVWQVAGENPAAFGQEFYETMISSQPDMAELFASSDIGRQSIRFFTMFNHAVRQMDDAAGFENAIIALVFKHKVYGVQMHHVDSFGLALKTTLRSTVGDRWDINAEEAWEWFWGRIHDCFEYGLRHTHSNDMPLNARDLAAAAAAQQVEDAVMAEDDTPNEAGQSDSTPTDADLSTARIFQPVMTLRTLQQRK